MTAQENSELELLRIAGMKTPVVNVYRREILPAVGGVAGITVIDGLGQFFYIKESSQPCLLQLDDGRELPFDVATGLNTRGTGMFKKITVKNIWSTPVTFEIVTGLGEYSDNRFTLVPSRDFALPVFEAKTELLGSDLNGLNANTSIDFLGLIPGAYPAYVKRKSIVISNLDLVNPIYVFDKDGKRSNAVHAGTSMELAVSGKITVKNETAGFLPCCISEIWVTR